MGCYTWLISYNLFIVIKILKPKLIVESGVYKGLSSWFILKAAPKNAKIFCLDINLSQLQYRSSKIYYLEKDNIDPEEIELFLIDYGLEDIEIIDKEINQVIKHGIKIHYNKDIKSYEEVEELSKKYHAVVLALGTLKPNKIKKLWQQDQQLQN